MTQRERIFAAIVSGVSKVKDIQVLANIGHSGSVRRELKQLKVDGLVQKNAAGGWEAVLPLFDGDVKAAVVPDYAPIGAPSFDEFYPGEADSATE